MISREKIIAFLEPRPAVGEIFELTIDGGAPWNNPMVMLKVSEGDANWRFVGRKIIGVQTRRFKLEIAQECANLKEVLRALDGKGKIPEGQWRMAFAEKYRLEHLSERLGVPDASWINEHGEAHFPFLTNLQ